MEIQNTDNQSNLRFMQMAVEQARVAYLKHEVPIGAIIICQNKVIAKAYNLTETLADPTAHAEMQAITAACDHIGGKYLRDCTLYVTVEPCPMCAAALRWAQIETIVWGTDDNKAGFSTVSKELIHPKTKVIRGIMKDECTQLLTSFFQQLRK